jgi:hypothetical protein
MTKELALASQQKLIVVPLRVEDVAPNAAFSYEFATRQWIDLFVDWEKAIDQLCERLARAMPPEAPGVGAPAAPPPIAEPQPLAIRKSPVGLLVGIAAAVLLTAAGVLFALPMLTAKSSANQQATAPAPAPVPVGAPVAPVATAAPAHLEPASAPSAQAAPRPRHAALAALGTAHTGEDSHSDAYICAHGDDADYRTTQACDRKDRVASEDNAGN